MIQLEYVCTKFAALQTSLKDHSASVPDRRTIALINGSTYTNIAIVNYKAEGHSPSRPKIAPDQNSIVKGAFGK